jgi:hypothetical protein
MTLWRDERVTISFGVDPVRAELQELIERMRAGETIDHSREHKHVDLKEEAGRRAPGGVILPGHAESLAAAKQLTKEAACMANTPGSGALIVDETSRDDEEFLPGLDEHVTAIEVLDRIIDRDGSAVSATTQLAQASHPATQLHEAARGSSPHRRAAQMALSTTDFTLTGQEWTRAEQRFHQANSVDAELGSAHGGHERQSRTLPPLQPQVHVGPVATRSVRRQRREREHLHARARGPHPSVAPGPPHMRWLRFSNLKEESVAPRAQS